MAGFTELAKSKQDLLTEPRLSWVGDLTPGQVKGFGAVEVAGALGLVAPWLTGLALRVGGMTTVITGGSRGIGAATARRLVRDGHRVVISYRQAAQEARLLEKELGVLAVQADTADEDDVARLFDAAGDDITGVVNNAGITSPSGPLAELRTEDLRRVVDVNVVGAIFVAREAARRMTSGSIVNVSSGAATLGSPGEYVHYAATKAAVDALTIGLGKELAPRGIRVNCVQPGTIRTGIHQLSGQPDRPDRVAGRVPLGRPGEAGEIANAIAWLLSDEASYMTGAILRMTGGT